MKRIMVVLTVALVMAAVLLVMAMPAFAAKTPPKGDCGKFGEVFFTFPNSGGTPPQTSHCQPKPG